MEASRGADKVTVSGVDEAECSETMVEIKIKTLDSETYTLRVNKCMPVPALKEQIETVTGVLSEQQRLICRGKVLKDDQLLSAYHVEDGHTLHLVVREPFNSPPTTTGMMGSESTQDHPVDSSSNGTHNRGNRIAHSVLLGTVNVADQGDGIMPDLNRIVSAVLSSIGISNIGVGSEGVDHREHGTERIYRALNTSGSPDSILPPPEQARGRAHTDALHGAFHIPTSVSLGPTPPTVIPDSLATLSQYLINLRREFDASGRSRSSDVGDASLHGIGGQDHHSSSHLGIENGLPTPASLAEVMQLTRETLIEQAGGCLSQLARQLVDHGSVTDHSARINIQSNAIRSGVLFQNLGALLLELGRTTMTLRMGHTPVEAVVNAGPAVFISSSGPNPIMVQPLPFQPGTSFGAIPMGNVHPGHGLGGGTLGSSFLPRNIDIRIRTGPSISVTGNGEERAGAPESPGQPDPASTAGANMAGQPVSGISSSPLFTGESGVRVVPVRTVVAAVPAALSRSSPETAGSAPGLFYPLLARMQHLSSGNINERRGSQAPGENHPIAADEAAQQRVPSPAAHQQNLGLNADTSRREGNCQTVNLSPANASSVVSGTSLPTDTSTQHQQGTLPSSNFDQGNPPNNNINRNDTQAGGGPQYAQESTRQMPSRFDQLLRTIFSGEQIHVNEINFQARARVPVMEQWEESRRDDEANGASTVDMDPGIFFSSLVRQIMPFISQTTPNEATNASSAREDTSNNLETERESLSEGGNSHRRSDPPSPRSSKRQKRE